MTNLQKSKDLLSIVIDNQDFGKIESSRFTALDVFQGIYYLIDQGLLRAPAEESAGEAAMLV